MSDLIAKIAVENTAFSFDDAFDYAIPNELINKVMPGMRVIVPFGNGNTKRQGFVFALRDKSSTKKLKKIISVLDKKPLLNNEMLNLSVYLKETTFCTLFDAAKAMLPSGIGLNFVTSYVISPDICDESPKDLSDDEKAVFEYLKNKNTFVKSDKLLKDLGFVSDFPIAENMAKKGLLVRNIDAVQKISDATIKMARIKSSYFEMQEKPKLSAKQNEIIKLLTDIGSASVKEICYFTGVTQAVISTLYKKDIIELFENETFRKPKTVSQNSVKENILLTDEQDIAFQNIIKQYHSNKAEGSLLFGVTGSGKTQVFLRLIDEVIADNKGVIMMVPEIALTPQMLDIFCDRYGDKVAVFHSALSMGERLDEYKRVKNGDAQIAIGTRSAVFAPFEKLGLIIMDEEQESTYKSEMSPRYHARDVAKYRTGYHKSLLVLASATPSIISYSAAKSGIYSLNKLNYRYGNAVLPEVSTVNTKYGSDLSKIKNLTPELEIALKENLEKGKQSILLLNRRGYNTFAACAKCGKVMVCPNCSISMTYHSKNGRLMCHYCGFSEKFTDVCRDCGEKAVVFSGMGTQKLEEELSLALPQAKILRLDTDTTSSRYSFENSLKKFTNLEYDIMVGTQMVAKGLDFPNVTLVGVISIDQQLYNDDYKSGERSFDLLTQVVGRSGRGDYKGKAIIQTGFPENEIINLAKDQDYEAFYELEMKIRKAMVYPPYCDICAISFVGADEVRTTAGSKVFLDMLKASHKSEYNDLNIVVLGPISPRIFKISGKYRSRIIVKCKNTKRLREFISGLLKDFSKNSQFSKITAFADMNPENTF
ncbi:MAG: primosomal protein N' [Oscillospiraceae bacterium]